MKKSQSSRVTTQRAFLDAGAVYLTRRAHFSASHRLHHPGRSEAWNRKVFGICNNRNGHGHNYVIEVTVCGEVDPESAMVLNLRDLKSVIEREILLPCDHKHLNHDVPWLARINPTAENLAIAFWRRLEGAVAPARLFSIRLLESEDNRVEYYGPSGRSC